VKLFPRLCESDWAAVRTVDVAHSLARGETFIPMSWLRGPPPFTTTRCSSLCSVKALSSSDATRNCKDSGSRGDQARQREAPRG
jgi:hypothetical protein